MTFREWKAGFAPGAAEAWAAARSPESVVTWAERWFKSFNTLVPLTSMVAIGLSFALLINAGIPKPLLLIANLAVQTLVLLVFLQIAIPIHRALAVALSRVSAPAQIPVMLALLRRIRRHDSVLKSVEIRRTRRAIHQALTRLLPETPSQPSLRSELQTALSNRFRDTESCDPHLIQAVERFLK